MAEISINDLVLNIVDQGSGPPVVLVHGFPLDHSMWRGQIERLSAQFRVIAPDLRGFGKSKSNADVVTMAQFADDIAALLDALSITEPISFCGLSMGGYIGWQFVQRHRDRLSRLIQCDTRAQADSDDAKATRLKAADHVLANGPEPLVATMMPKLFADTTMANQPDVVQATREVMLGTAPAAIAAAQRGMAERPDVTKDLSKVDVPTLILCGERDAISPPDEMCEIANAIPGATFVQIDGAGHMAPLEDPQTVNEAILKFLSETP